MNIEQVSKDYLETLRDGGLPEYPQMVRIVFADGSAVTFENANHFTYNEATRVLVMTQNCGNHTFDIVGATLKYYRNPALNNFDR
jgi:hypothetical protein